MQSESDAGNPNYAAELRQLFADLDADVRETAGQAQTVQFFICLTAVPDIALAQQQVAAAMPNVHIACDTAKFPKSDGTHLTAQGSLEAGCALARTCGTSSRRTNGIHEEKKRQFCKSSF